MNTTSETKTGTNRGGEEQTFIVLGVLLQFLSTPEQINDQISVMSSQESLFHSIATPIQRYFMC